MIEIAFTFYLQKREVTQWDLMPQIPKSRDTVHISPSNDPEDRTTWHVGHVSWVREDGKWHAEVGLS